MSDTLFKQVNYTLGNLMQYIDLGEIGLPDIQRPFVWNNAKIRDLFDSIYRGYPIGYLLFWQVGVEDANPRTIGVDHKQKAPKLLIVDGQQRLTALFAVTRGVEVVRENYQKERVQIAFRPLDQKFEVTDAAVQRDPEFIPDISAIWAEGSSLFTITREYIRRLETAREVSAEEIATIETSIEHLRNILNFPFTALELSATVDEEQVAEVFVRINSTGKPLNQADFILTLMSVFWDEGRFELEEFCREARTPSQGKASPYNQFIQPYPDQLLRVAIGYGFRRARLQYAYSILRGKDLETEQFSEERRVAQFARLREAQDRTLNLTNWHDFLNVLNQAGFRSGKMITSNNNLLYSYVIYLIGREDYRVDPFVLKSAIARWYFMVNLSGRYTGSPESTVESDLARFRGVDDPHAFVAILDRVVRDTLTEDFWNITLPNDLATSSSRSPSMFAYFAALNLLNARVLFSKNSVAALLDPAAQGARAAIERHHLFPRSYLHRLGYTSTRDTNQIANYALVEWGDNTSISDQSPAEYYPIYASRFSSDELERMCYWHALPEGWHQMEYEEFLEERRRLMARVIRDGFSTLLDIADSENVISGVPFGEQRLHRRYPH